MSLTQLPLGLIKRNFHSQLDCYHIITHYHIKDASIKTRRSLEFLHSYSLLVMIITVSIDSLENSRMEKMSPSQFHHPSHFCPKSRVLSSHTRQHFSCSNYRTYTINRLLLFKHPRKLIFRIYNIPPRTTENFSDFALVLVTCASRVI